MKQEEREREERERGRKRKKEKERERKRKKEKERVLFIFAEGFFLFIMFSTAIMTNLASFVKNSFLTQKFNPTEHFKS